MNKFPRWMAPNLITLLGMIAVLITQLICIYYTGINGTETGPNWIFLAAGFRYLIFNIKSLFIQLSYDCIKIAFIIRSHPRTKFAN